ncbi:MAG: RNA polymerase sigma factor [Thermoanaerobaculia bacterium]
MRDLAPRLLRYCKGRLWSAESAEDVAQSALMALVVRWRAFGPPDSPAAFTFSIARRRAWRAAVRDRLFQPLSTLAFRNEPVSDPLPEAEAKSELRRLRSALQKLPVREKEAILLVVAGELAIVEAAEVLGISESALKMRLVRARQKLKESRR